MRALQRLRVSAALREGKPMFALVAAQGGAMLLSFAYYLVAARALDPAGFGVLRYTITLSEIAFGVLQVLSIGLARELGAARGNEQRTGEIIGTSVVVTGGLWLLSLVACLVAVVAGATGSADTVGLLVVLSGLTVFTIYWAIGRGVGAIRRMAITYVGGSLVQLVTFSAFAAATNPSSGVALIIFGVSSIVPVVVCEAVRPIIRGRPIKVTGEELRRLGRIGRPLLLAQICYMTWNASDQIWVDSQLGAREVGLYGAASNLSRLFLVLPLGVTGILLPRVAELREARREVAARRLIAWSVGGLVAVTLCLALVVAAIREPLLSTLYGSSYRVAAPILLALAATMVAYTAFATLTTAAVGWGRPSVYLLGMSVAAATQVVLLVAFPGETASSAAWIHLVSISAGLAVTVLWLIYRPLGGPRSPAEGLA